MSTPIEHYQANYCEENIWQLCGRFLDVSCQASVVFISNPRRSVALYHQRASDDPLLPVVWDYHVILLVADINAGAGSWDVWDPDCCSGPTLSLEDYMRLSCAPGIADCFQAMFRPIPAIRYRQLLRSDRRHMRENGVWLSPPPPWPCIGEGSNVLDIADFSCPDYGEVLELGQFRQRYGLTV